MRSVVREFVSLNAYGARYTDTAKDIWALCDSPTTCASDCDCLFQAVLRTPVSLFDMN